MCEKLLQRSVSCEDIREASGLPILVEQEEQSRKLENYIDLKRQQHEEITKTMYDEIQQVNECVDKDVTDYIKVAKEELEWLEFQTDSVDFEQILTIEIWLSSCDTNKKIKVQIKKVIDDLLTDLKVLEQTRAEATTNILLKYKDKVTNMRVQSVEETDRFFKTETADNNLKIIKNFQRYEDVNLQLEVKGQKIYGKRQNVLKSQSKHLAVDHAQYLWKKIEERQQKKHFTETVYNMTQDNLKAREDLKQATNHLVRELSELAKRLEIPAEYDIQNEFWENWAGSLNLRLDSLEMLCINVEQLIKVAIASVAEEIEEQHDTITRNVSWNFQNIDNFLKNKKSILSETRNLKTNQSKELEDLHLMWQNTLDTLVSKINRARTFIFDLTSIWTCHLERVNELHKEIENTLESSYNSSLKKYNEKNAKLKGQIKTAREAKDIVKLETLCANIQERFLDLEKEWEESYEDQLEKIESIKRKNVERLIGKHLAHILDFLNVKYPKRLLFSDLMYDPSIRSSSTTGSEVEVDVQIGLCFIYMNAVENRGLGMYEMLERFVPYCETWIREETEEWVQMFIQEVVNKYDAKLSEIDESQKETLQNLKQIRFAELQIHSDRLASHVCGVKKELTEISKLYEEVKIDQKSALAEFSKKAANLTEIKSDPKGLQQNIYELEQDWNSFTEVLQKQIFENKEILQNKATSLIGANNLFTKTAKSFKNGGNYSPEELKTLNKELRQLDKTITNQKKMLLKSYEEMSKSINRQVMDSKLEKVQELLKDETLKKVIGDSLSIIRMRLRKEVISMKNKEKLLEQKCALFSSLKKVDDDLLNDIFHMITQMNDFMVLPCGVQSLECTESRQSSIVDEKDKKTKKLLGNHPTNSLLKHTTSEVNSYEENFLAKTKGLIYNKYSSLIDVIQKTSYRKLSDKKEVKKTNPNNQVESKIDLEDDVQKELIKQVKIALRAYNSECELAWLGQSREFLSQISDMQKLLNELSYKELETVHNNYMTSLEAIEKEYLHSIIEKHTKEERVREHFLKHFVLPLAHPTQYRKLREFKEKAVNVGETQKSDDSSCLSEYKADLQKKHNTYVEKIKLLKDSLSENQTQLFSQDLCKTLFENSNGISNVYPYEIENTAVYPLSIWSDENEPNQACQKAPSIFLVFLSSSSETATGASLDTFDEVIRLPINRIAAENAKESALKIQKLYDFASKYKSSNCKGIDDWLRALETKIKDAQTVFSSICN